MCATDFIGYIFDLNTIGYRGFKNVGAAIDTKGKFRIFSLNKKPIKNRRAIKIYKKLFKIGFLEFNDEPFDEFKYRSDIQINPEEATFIEQPLFLYTGRQEELQGFGNDVYYSDETESDCIEQEVENEQETR